MTTQTIQSHDISIASVFQSFYLVPDYQREYVWGTDEVEQLLNDINGELGIGDLKSAPEYFIGSIVVCPGEGGVLELIDGQQRMTTLFVMLCAMRDWMKDCGKEPPGALQPQIAATSTDESGNDQYRYRLDLQYEDSGDVLVRMAKHSLDDVENLEPVTRSIANIINAYTVVRTFLDQEFSENPEAARAFYGYLTNKVKLIRIQTEDVAKALKIFETINDRGVGLDSMDLLKNLLFMKADRDQFNRLKEIWKELQDTIFNAGEKPLRFLRYFIFSRYDVDALREDEIYGWFSKNDMICGYSSDPLRFAKELLAGAKAYKNFLDGNDKDGKPNRYLENMRLLGGKAAKQHLIMLLAGSHLKVELFTQLCQEVENLFFCYVITREPTRDFERNFARWAMTLRKIKSEDKLKSFFEEHFERARALLANRFEDAFKRLTGDMLQKYRLKYLLAKLSQHVDEEAYGDTDGTKWLSRYTDPNFEIEHIYPQTPDDEALQEFGSLDHEEIPQMLGNLVLVEKSINASLGNHPYSKKRLVYPKSQLLLTRSLVERPEIGKNTKIDLAAAILEPFEKWNSENVSKRQEILTELAFQVWKVPEILR